MFVRVAAAGAAAGAPRAAMAAAAATASGTVSQLLWLSDALLTRWEHRVAAGGAAVTPAPAAGVDVRQLAAALPWARWLEPTPPSPPPMAAPPRVRGSRPRLRVRIEGLSSYDLTDVEVDHWKRCSICWEPFSDMNRTCYALDCYHVFHRRCAEEWWRHDPSCPLCRNRVMKTTRAGLQLRERKIRLWTRERERTQRAARRRVAKEQAAVAREKAHEKQQQRQQRARSREKKRTATPDHAGNASPSGAHGRGGGAAGGKVPSSLRQGGASTSSTRAPKATRMNSNAGSLASNSTTASDRSRSSGSSGGAATAAPRKRKMRTPPAAAKRRRTGGRGAGDD